MTWDPSRRLLTIEEAAHSAGRPASTIRRWLSENRIEPTAWIGRSPLILESDVLECDAEMTRKGAQASHRGVRQ